MNHRWECRHSSAEMLYLEIAGDRVRCYFDHSPGSGEIYTFDEVMAGGIDEMVNSLFGGKALEDLNQAVRERSASSGK